MISYLSGVASNRLPWPPLLEGPGQVCWHLLPKIFLDETPETYSLVGQSSKVCDYLHGRRDHPTHSQAERFESELSVVLLGRVRDAGFGAKSWLAKDHAYYHAYLLQKEPACRLELALLDLWGKRAQRPWFILISQDWWGTFNSEHLPLSMLDGGNHLLSRYPQQRWVRFSIEICQWESGLQRLSGCPS